jgi:hypothetical protein
MVLAIDIPDGAKVEQVGNRVYIIVDESKSKADLWKAAFWLWLTNGKSQNDFSANKLLSGKRVEVSYSDSLKMFNSGD